MIDPQLEERRSPVTARTLRQFAALWLAVLGALAAWKFSCGHYIAAAVWTVLALTVGLLGLLRPEAIRLVYGVALAVTAPIGWAVSKLILFALFIGLFTPVALLFRLLGRDALERQRSAGRKTFWRPKPPAPSARNYFRQF